MDIHTIQFVNLSSLLSDGEYEDLCSEISDFFTWGDTDLALVGRDFFLAGLDSGPVKDKLIKQLGSFPNVYINLY